jgi:hypothetical protein
MEMEFRILTGTAQWVEKELNKLRKQYSVIVQGMSATDNTTTVIVEIYEKFDINK